MSAPPRSWVRLDASWHTDGRLLACSHAARCLYLAAIAHSHVNNTDGRVSEHEVRMLCRVQDAPYEAVVELVDNDLWTMWTNGHGQGWEPARGAYLTWQESARDRDIRRAAAAARQRRKRRRDQE